MKIHCFFAIAPVALAMAAATPGSAPRLDAWKLIGPGGGGTTIGPTISPHDSNIVLEHCDMTAGYITMDGGDSWRLFHLRTVIETFAFDPVNPKRIYAGNAALWRSDDTGRTWRMLFPNPASNTVEHQNGDHSEYSLTSDDKSYVSGLSIRRIVVDPRDSKVVYMAYLDPQRRTTILLISTDSGASFRRDHEFRSDQLSLLVDTPDGLLAVGAQGVVYRKTAGNTWITAAGLGKPVANASAGRVGGKTYIFVTTSGGKLFASEDQGKTWESRTPALGQQSGEFGALAMASGDGRIVYTGFRQLKLGPRPEDLYTGIAKTVDAGRSWSIVFRESTKTASNLDPSWIEQRAADGPGTSSSEAVWAAIYFESPYSLATAPGNPNICYVTDLFRTFRTLDGGKTWAQVNSVRTPDNHWTTRGLDVTTDYGVQFDPFDPRHIFIDYTDIGVFSSSDGGESWDSSTDGVPENWRNTTYWLAFDPKVKNLMWGAFSGVHDLPRPKNWRDEADMLTFVGGVGISTDGGSHWTPSNKGMEETSVTHILLDAASPVGRRTLYACGFGRGVYKSTDNGQTWQLKNGGISESYPSAWRIVQANDGALYLILSRTNSGVYGETKGSGAVYKSVDGAEHWTKIKLPAGSNGPTGLALDPRDNRRMYLAAWGQQRIGVDTGGGVFLSTDGGQSWRQVFSQSQHVYDVTIDPKAPDTLYICGFDAAAYRSTDAGLHWTRIRGYNFKWGHRVIMDPNDTSKIYITTYGGSVWHGPASGDPTAPEDILDPVPIAQSGIDGAENGKASSK